MRIVGVAVVGILLLCSAFDARADEPKRERSEKCVEICNFDFEKCTANAGPKGHGRCNIDVVRCKNACPFETIEEPAVPTAKSHQRCVDGCRDVYQKCLAKPENKSSGGTCAADDMRCEKACPAPPEPEVAGVPPGAPSADGTQAAPAAKAPPPAKPRRAARVEGHAAPAPAAATPAPPVVERVEAPPSTVRSEAVTPPSEAPVAPAAAARPAQEERGFFATLGCFFVSCDPVGSTPCLQRCGADFDQCQVRESKRGGECSTRLMHCRKACSAAAPVQ